MWSLITRVALIALLPLRTLQALEALWSLVTRVALVPLRALEALETLCSLIARVALVAVLPLRTLLAIGSLVALIATGLLSGYFAPAWWLDIHSWAGYGIAGLIIFRLVWAVFGFEYSRFSNFTYAPGETLRHLRSFLRRQPGHYTGHNPLGAMMVFALIAVISGIVVSGLVSLGGKEDQGPLATVLVVSRFSLLLHRVSTPSPNR